MKDVAGKVAFVTGGASGLGLAMAQSFTGAGMKVVIADIQDDALDALHAVPGGAAGPLPLARERDRDAAAQVPLETACAAWDRPDSLELPKYIEASRSISGNLCWFTNRPDG